MRNPTLTYLVEKFVLLIQGRDDAVLSYIGVKIKVSRCGRKRHERADETFLSMFKGPQSVMIKLNLSSSKYLLTCFDSTHVFTYLYVDNSSMDMCMEKGRERHSALSALSIDLPQGLFFISFI